jgi:hypothetical protein
MGEWDQVADGDEDFENYAWAVLCGTYPDGAVVLYTGDPDPPADPQVPNTPPPSVEIGQLPKIKYPRPTPIPVPIPPPVRSDCS